LTAYILHFTSQIESNFQNQSPKPNELNPKEITKPITMRFSTLTSLLLSLSIPAAVLAQEDNAASSEPEVQIEYITTIENCEERRTSNGDMVRMHYRGSLADGDEFDNSYDRKQPLKFKLGAGRVIKGFVSPFLLSFPFFFPHAIHS
jgi:hypothetical protein